MSRWILLSAATLLLFSIFFYKTASRAPERGQDGATFGEVSLTLEYATTSEARQRGLSGRSSVPENYGMLFVFSRSGEHGFWMKDMLVPIDIFWLDEEGRVVSLNTNVSPESYPTVFYPTSPARYVLETRAGFGEKHDIKRGTPLVLKNPPTVSD